MTRGPRRSRTGRSGSSSARSSAAGARTNGRRLHVINIRDFHVPGPRYDVERRAYGGHRESGTWGVRYLDGLDRYLDPTGCADECLRRGRRRADLPRAIRLGLRFQAAAETRGGRAASRPSSKTCSTSCCRGSDEDLEESRRLCARGASARSTTLRGRSTPARSRVHRIRPTSPSSASRRTSRCRCCSSACARYDLPNLAVSTPFTASTLERHLSGLDYAAKGVLDVEVVHGINDLVGYLGPPAPVEDEEALVARSSSRATARSSRTNRTCSPSRTRSCASTWLLTERRSLDVYERIKRTNTFLILFGCTFLVLTSCSPCSTPRRHLRLADRCGHRRHRPRPARVGVRVQADPRPPAEPHQSCRLQDDPGEPLEDGPRPLPPDDAADTA